MPADTARRRPAAPSRRGTRRTARALTAAPLAVTPAMAVIAAPAPAPRAVHGPRATGADIVAIAMAHVAERYVLGARAPMANASWKGPWDCAEFASWCVYQASGVLYGVQPADDPVRADAYTGFWGQQAERDAATVPIEDAVRIAGACLLRKPGGGPIGHIAISTGDGKTVEAHSSKHGVGTHSATGRRWDYGVLVPGITYFLAERAVAFKPPANVLRLTSPLTRGPKVEQVQKKLAAAGYATGAVDGIYGPQTATAVMEFQADHGLVADGEVGNTTLKALKLKS